MTYLKPQMYSLMSIASSIDAHQQDLHINSCFCFKSVIKLCCVSIANIVFLEF